MSADLERPSGAPLQIEWNGILEGRVADPRAILAARKCVPMSARESIGCPNGAPSAAMGVVPGSVTGIGFIVVHLNCGLTGTFESYFIKPECAGHTLNCKPNRTTPTAEANRHPSRKQSHE